MIKSRFIISSYIYMGNLDAFFNLPPLIKRLQEAIKPSEIYLVGGAVRDGLLDRPMHDYDLATNLPARQIMLKARAAGLKANLVQAEQAYPVVIVESEGFKLEVAQFRKELYLGAKLSQLQLATLEEDSARRDLTINALYFQLSSGQLLDPQAGQVDLLQKLVRFVGDPAERIEEDPVRIMRAVRLASRLGFTLESKTAAALYSPKAIQRIKPERLKRELDWLLQDPSRGQALQLLQSLGILELILPEVEALAHTPQSGPYHFEGNVLTHTLHALNQLPLESSLTLLWATLLHDIGKPQTVQTDQSGQLHFPGHEQAGVKLAQNLFVRLKFAQSETKAIKYLIGQHMAVLGLLRQSQGHWRQLMANPLFPLQLELLRVDAGASLRENGQPDWTDYQAIQDFYQQLVVQHQNAAPDMMRELQINGSTLIAHLNLNPSQLVHLGELKAKLTQWYIEAYGVAPSTEGAKRTARAAVLEQARLIWLDLGY